MTGEIISGFELKTLYIPLRYPFVTALGQRTQTINIALQLTLKSGCTGYGEASTSLAQRHLQPKILHRTLKALANFSKGRDIRDGSKLVQQAWKMYPDINPAVAAFEAAIVSALAASKNMSLHQWFGASKDRAQTDVTVSAWNDLPLVRRFVKSHIKRSFNTLKIKVGGDFDKDFLRFLTVLKIAPKANILLDGNQGFSLNTALRFIDAVLGTGANVKLFEQPLVKHDLKGMATLTKRSPIPIAADESISTVDEAKRVIDMNAARLINIKFAKSGIQRSLEIANMARQAKMGLMIGCMAESSQGLNASVAMALGKGYFQYIDLDSDLLLRESKRMRQVARWIRQDSDIFIRH